MLKGLLNDFKMFLVGARMIEISYGETFCLLFEKSIYHNAVKNMQLLLTLDTECWFGSRDEWMRRIGKFEDSDVNLEKEDCLLAYELTRLRYNNLIDVEQIDFLDGFLSIQFTNRNILSMAYYAESDYAWILEEVSQKKEQDRMMICCQGNELYQNNISEFVLSE